MSAVFFVTGTDTSVGKTVVAAALLRKARLSGFSTLGLKPVASDCLVTPDGLRNEDALALQKETTYQLSYDRINPITFEEPIAPHLAANKKKCPLSADSIVNHCGHLINKHPAFTIIEGAGGWRVPLNDNEYFSDIATQLGLQVILVAGIRLGCINHAFLTAEAIRSDNLKIAGWVANNLLPNTLYSEEIIATIGRGIDAPCLGILPFHQDCRPDFMSDYLTLPAGINPLSDPSCSLPSPI